MTAYFNCHSKYSFLTLNSETFLLFPFIQTKKTLKNMRVEILNIFLIFMLGLLRSVEGYNLGLEDMPHISDPSPTRR